MSEREKTVPEEAGGLQTEASSLDPRHWAEVREQAHRMLDDMLGYMEGIGAQPVWQPIPHEVRGRFGEELPVAPGSLEAVHEEFMRAVVPYTARNGHPGFMGWVQGGGTVVGMLAEMLAAGLNANVGGRDQVPLEVERQVTGWMRKLFGFPEGASGVFVTGTSMANLLAVVIARNARLGAGVRRKGVAEEAAEGQQQGEKRPLRLRAYASTAVHGCVGRALDVAGLGSEALRFVRVDGRQRMDLGALEALMAEDREAGLTPFLVVGTAGTVDTGAIDDLAALAEICARDGLWFHVDGALGALAMLAAEFRPRLKGIERADSLAFDFHKWAQVPYDAGFLLVRDGALHRQAFASPSAYLGREERGMAAGSPWPVDLGVDLSRGFRALKTWATFKVYGADALGAVVRESCALARYLETRVLKEPELELMAGSDLNIVCFRYRFEEQGEEPDKLNREIVIRLQEGGLVAPSTTTLVGRVAIRAAMVNHRTTRAEVNSLVEQVLTTGRSLRRQEAESSWEPWVACRTKVRALDTQLACPGELASGAEAALRVERAMLLAQMGKSMEARADHLRVLEIEPAHKVNLLELGRLLATSGQLKAAELVYAEAVKYYPADVVARVNHGGVLLQGQQLAAARAAYEAALELDPACAQAHGGMYYVLDKLGETGAAAMHQQKAFGQKNLFKAAYRGAGPPVPVVLLVSSNGGNTPIEKLLDDRIFETYVVVADFFDATMRLPEHELVVNGIGDWDHAPGALEAAEALVRGLATPVVNAPAAVRVTGRCENARRLAGVPGVRTPAVAPVPRTLLEGGGAVAALAALGFRFPLLLRAPGFHMGEHFVRVDTAGELAARVAELPGEELLAIEFLDARGTDGSVRKYRAMMIDGELYPLHLAISGDWKIHYFSAEMAERPEHRAEEARFLADMPGVVGAKALAALTGVQAALGLEYAGIDFGLSAEGELLLFEANATMVVEQPAEDRKWDYRRAAVSRIHDAVREMLLRRVRVGVRRPVPVSLTTTLA